MGLEYNKMRTFIKIQTLFVVILVAVVFMISYSILYPKTFNEGFIKGNQTGYKLGIKQGLDYGETICNKEQEVRLEVKRIQENNLTLPRCISNLINRTSGLCHIDGLVSWCSCQKDGEPIDCEMKGVNNIDCNSIGPGVRESIFRGK